MRYLTIVRHSEAAPGSSDVARVLTPRGRDQALWLRAQASDPDGLGRFGPTTALVSSAARTRETYATAFAGTPFVQALATSDLIYNGRRDVRADDLLAALAEIDPVVQSLLVVAHSPTVLELLAALAGEELPEEVRTEGFPVGAAFVVTLPDQPISRTNERLVAAYVPPL